MLAPYVPVSVEGRRGVFVAYVWCGGEGRGGVYVWCEGRNVCVVWRGVCLEERGGGRGGVFSWHWGV